MRFYSDDPYRDYDRWEEFQERMKEGLRKGKRSVCNEAIYEDEDHYDIDGDLLHEECLVEWAEQFKKRSI